MKINLLIILILSYFSLFSQITDLDYSYQLLEKKGQLQEQLDWQDQALSDFYKNKSEILNRQMNVVYQVPCVVHIVWDNNNGTNITDAQVQLMIENLNKDFSRTNIDAGQTRPIWDAIASAVDIQFCLAQTSPDGGLTPGITRTQTTHGVFDTQTGTSEDIKSASTGGKDAWNTQEYLNIWVGDLTAGTGFGVVGYSTLPGSHGLTDDGLVLDVVSLANNQLTRVPTHELGHYFGLLHPWSNSCSVDGDGIADTPITTYDHLGLDCNTTPDGCPLGEVDQFENFMSYSNCPNMFTIDQASFMKNTLETARASLLISNICELDELSANFVPNTPTIRINAGETITFTNASQGFHPITDWNWNFESGVSASALNTQGPHLVTYDTPGVFEVSLTIADGLSTSTKTVSQLVEVIPPPANNEACQAINIPMTGVCTPLSASNIGATASTLADPTCGTFNANGDVWFETTVGPSGYIQIDLTDAGINANMALYDGLDCNTLNEIACSTNNTFYSSLIPSGSQVWIRIWDENAGVGSFEICAFEPPPPPLNDNPCTAEPLTVNSTCVVTPGTTAGALNSALSDPNCSPWGYQGGDVWYTAVVTARGLRLTLFADEITDGGIAIYSGTDCNSLAIIACDESRTVMPDPLTVSPSLVGETVWIRVWEADNDNPGSFGICAVEPPPPPTNNDPCTAEFLIVDTNCVNTIGTTLSSVDSGVADPSCSSSYQGGDVWYSTIVPASGFMHVNLTTGSILDGGIAVYSGLDCNTLTEEACTERTSTMPPPLVITPANALAGQQVWIRVWEGYNDNPGSFEICLTNDTVLSVDTNSFTIPQLVEDVLVSTCTQVSNIQFDGDSTAIAYFDGGSNALGMSSGIILGTGSVVVLTGQGTDVVTQETTNTSVAADLSSISVLNGGAADMHDELILEFDFIAASDTAKFDFVFASTEYPTYEFSQYNDVIAVLVSGPGINGPYSDNAINIALVLGTAEPISISSINGTTHSAFFGGYTAGNSIPNFNVGGYTIPLKAIIDTLIPNETYHIKIAIADAGDGSLSSYLFLKEQSFLTGGETTIINQAISQNISEGEDVTFTITATGTNLSYQWQKDGQAISDGGNISGCTSNELSISSVTDTDAGIYNCIISGDCGTITSNEASLSVNVGINKYPQTNICIYPNPTKESFIIKGVTGNENYKIYSLSGSLIQTGKVSKQSISILNYPKGIYIIEVISKENIQKFKLIKE